MAEREGKYLVELFNKVGKQNGGKALCVKDIPLGEPFIYKHLGSMASVGRYKALVDLRQSKVTWIFSDLFPYMSFVMIDIHIYISKTDFEY